MPPPATNPISAQMRIDEQLEALGSLVVFGLACIVSPLLVCNAVEIK